MLFGTKIDNFLGSTPGTFAGIAGLFTLVLICLAIVIYKVKLIRKRKELLDNYPDGGGPLLDADCDLGGFDGFDGGGDCGGGGD